MHDNLSHILPLTIQAAKASGEILMSYYGKLEHIQNKSFSGDLVTEADTASETYLINFFNQHFPDYGIIGEESGHIHSGAGSPWQWIIDPLDGTTNFAHQHPFFCVSIALTHNGQPVLGVVYNPFFNELFDGYTSNGARLNGKKIQVSTQNKLENSLLASGFPYDRRENYDNNYKEFCRLTQMTQGVRRCGSAALELAYVAAGRQEGYWERGIKAWDIAAGIILIKEAGGKVSRYDESPLESIFEDKILATNGHIHSQLSQALLS